MSTDALPAEADDDFRREVVQPEYEPAEPVRLVRKPRMHVPLSVLAEQTHRAQARLRRQLQLLERVEYLIGTSDRAIKLLEDLVQVLADAERIDWADL